MIKNRNFYVTAPAYPSVDLRYEPPVYEYIYLLSPAKTWADFGSLETRVNTPYYMTQSGPEGFERTGAGYAQRLAGLPEGELTFTLCAEAAPTKPVNTGYFPVGLIAIIAVALVVIGVIIIIFKRKENRD